MLREIGFYIIGFVSPGLLAFRILFFFFGHENHDDDDDKIISNILKMYHKLTVTMCIVLLALSRYTKTHTQNSKVLMKNKLAFFFGAGASV